jgi:hypothetical protein
LTAVLGRRQKRSSTAAAMATSSPGNAWTTNRKWGQCHTTCLQVLS